MPHVFPPAFRFLTALAMLLVGVVSVQAQPRVYVGSGQRNVSVVDATTHTLLEAIPTPRAFPVAMAASADDAFIYVAQDTLIGIIDATDSTVVGEMHAGGGAADIAATPDGFLFAAVPGLNEVEIFDTGSTCLVGTIATPRGPTGLVLTPDGAFAYVTHQYINAITVISTAARTVVATIEGIGGHPSVGLNPITIAPNGRFGYVTSPAGYDVWTIDLEQNVVVGTTSIPASVTFGLGIKAPVAVTPDGKLFAIDRVGFRVAVKDLQTGDLLGLISTGSRPRTTPSAPTEIIPWKLAASADGTEVYVALNDGGLFVIDVAALAITDRIELAGGGPTDILVASAVATHGPVGRFLHRIPGRIEAEDYDVGGAGVGYTDATAGNEGLTYRNDDVDIKASAEGGYAVGWITAGESLTYSAVVDHEGRYTVQARIGSAMPGRTLHVEVDGTDVTGAIEVPELSGWDQYQTVSITGVPLHAGRQLVRVVAGPQDFLDLQWIAFAVETTGELPGPFTRLIRPRYGRLFQATDYDLGGEGIGYHDTTPGNEQGYSVYRTDDVDIKPSREGGYAVGWIMQGESLTYTLPPDIERIFEIDVRIGSPLPGRSVHIDFDGLGGSTIMVPQVADWDQYQTVRVRPFNLSSSRPPRKVTFVFSPGWSVPRDFIDFKWFRIWQ